MTLQKVAKGAKKEESRIKIRRREEGDVGRGLG
jgi:hypothetical protein